jgi:hypothetical protein
MLIGMLLLALCQSAWCCGRALLRKQDKDRLPLVRASSLAHVYAKGVDAMPASQSMQVVHGGTEDIAAPLLGPSHAECYFS